MERTDYSGVSSDAEIVTLWLAGRPVSTVGVYRPVAEEFLAYVGEKGLRGLTAADAITWKESLVGAEATRARIVSTVKSLLSFAWRVGYTDVNVGRILKCVKVVHRLHEKLLEEEQVAELVSCASSARDRLLLRLLYSSGIRIAEAVKLRHIDLGKGRVSVLGKGHKARTLVVPEDIVEALKALRPHGADDRSFVFRSRTGKRLDVRDAREAVYKAAREMGIRISPHWLRHAHATHSVDHGCPIHVLQHSLGHANLATTSVYLHVRPNVGSSTYVPPV